MGSVITRVLTPDNTLQPWLPRYYFRKDLDGEKITELRLFIGGSGKTRGRLVTLPVGRDDFQDRTPESFSPDERYKMLYDDKCRYPILVSPEKGIIQRDGILLGIQARKGRASTFEIEGDIRIIAVASYDDVICPVVLVMGDCDIKLSGFTNEHIRVTHQKGKFEFSSKEY